MEAVPYDPDAQARRARRAKRKSRGSRKNEDGGNGNGNGKEKEDLIQELMNSGWRKLDNAIHTQAICFGRVIFDRRCHVTESLIFEGHFVVVEELKCDGFFAFSGTLDLWDKPAIVKTFVVNGNSPGIINGDVVVTSTAYIIGKCTIQGTLTVVGTLAVHGTLICKSLVVTGNMERLRRSARIEAADYSINGCDAVDERMLQVKAWVDQQAAVEGA